MPRMLLLLSGLLLLVSQVHAVPITHAVHARTVLKPCLPNTYPCPPSLIDEAGGAQATSAVSSQADQWGQSAAVDSRLGGPTSTPILKARASSVQGLSTESSTVAVQSYTYSGLDGGSFVLNFDLHGVVTTDPVFGSISDANIAFRIGFVRDTAQLDYDPSFGWGTLFWEAGGVPVDGSVQTFISEGSPTNILGSITIADLLNNESFFVVTELVARAENGAVADAYNTVTMSFVEPAGLTPSGTAVSTGTVATVPSLLLLLGGLLVVGRMASHRESCFTPA